MMKRFLLLITASVIIGFALFVIFHLVFAFDKFLSVSVGISAAVAGVAVEYLRPYFNSLVQKQKDEISTGVRKNLKHRG